MCAGILCAVLASGVQKTQQGFGITAPAHHETVSAKIPVEELIRICREPGLILGFLLALIQQGIEMATEISPLPPRSFRMWGFFRTDRRHLDLYVVVAMSWAWLPQLRSAQAGGSLLHFIGIPVGRYLLHSVPLAGNAVVLRLLQILPVWPTGFCCPSAPQSLCGGVPEEMKTTAMAFFQAVAAVGAICAPVYY